jgi:hypothetical protein
MFANVFESVPHFNHALELLLHKVLETEAETLVGFSRGKLDTITRHHAKHKTFLLLEHVAAILPSVIKFLENYPQFLDIVVQCARKTEVALWDYLFSIAGPPQDLFEVCN